MEIKRLDQPGRRGYRACTDTKGSKAYTDTYAFYDIFWTIVSDHYLIQEEYRFRQYNHKLGTKPIHGPYPVAIREADQSLDTIDELCLEIIKRKFKKELEPELNHAHP